MCTDSASGDDNPHSGADAVESVNSATALVTVEGEQAVPGSPVAPIRTTPGMSLLCVSTNTTHLTVS